MDDPLVVVGLAVERRNEGVGDDVVDELRAHAAGIAEEAHLHRRRPIGEDLGPGAARVALEVDEHVDAVVVDLPGGIPVREMADVDEPVERGDEPLARVAAVVGAEAIADDLEALAIVPLDQLGDEGRRGVAAVVRGEVADAHAAVPVPAETRRVVAEDLAACHVRAARPHAGVRELVGWRRGRHRQRRKRRDPDIARAHGLEAARLLRIEAAPVADMAPQVGRARNGLP